MARKKKPVHKVQMTDGKRNIIQQLLQEYDFQVPQDCNSTFEPQVVKKRQKDISDIDQKIISIYAKGMNTRQISNTLEDIYGFDTIHYSNRDNGIIRKLAAYVILGINQDGLSGIKEAITAAYPKTKYQRCIVYQVRNTMEYVAEKDRKPFCADLKTIYQAPTKEKALEALARVTEKWSQKYPDSNEKPEAKLGCHFPIL